MAKRQGTQPRVNVEDAYTHAHLVAQDLAAQISAMLGDMPAPGDEEHPINWAHLGDIYEVNQRLSSVVAFLNGTEK